MSRGSKRAEEQARQKVAIRTLAIIAITWGALVAAILSWQAFTYTGLFAALAEWQFRTFDRMYPIATIALVVFVLQLPILALIVLRLRSRRRKYGPANLHVTISRTQASIRLLAGLGITALVMAIVLAVIGAVSGSQSDKPIGSIDLSQNASKTAEFVNARGLVRYDRVGYYREGFVVVGRDLWLAPLMTSDEDRKIRYFIQVPRTDQAREAERKTVSGIVRRAAVPGGLRRLYEYEGYSIAEPAYVLFESRASARWPFFSAAADLALLALLTLVAFAALRLHLRRLARLRT